MRPPSLDNRDAGSSDVPELFFLLKSCKGRRKREEGRGKRKEKRGKRKGEEGKRKGEGGRTRGKQKGRGTDPRRQDTSGEGLIKGGGSALQEGGGP
jgi:hypothetical protein